MLQTLQGNILEAETEAIVNTVNCVGIMGRGIALQFKNAYPDNFSAYQTACRKAEVEPGKMFIFETTGLTRPKFIINFPTKRHWRGQSRIEDIKSGLEALIADLTRLRIRSIAIPPLGSGLGGLEWSEVRPLIISAFAALPEVNVLLFEPRTGTEERPFKAAKAPKMTPGRATLVELIDRYLRGLLDPFITLLEVHKLMYFMQESGEKLRLSYQKAPFGPYAENLRHVLKAVEGHLIAGYEDGGDAPEKELALVPGALRDAAKFLEGYAATQKNFNRVVELVEGFETPFGLELLSTVHWLSHREGAATLGDIVLKTHEWAPHKRKFSDAQISIAYDVLRSKGWLSSQ